MSASVTQMSTRAKSWFPMNWARIACHAACSSIDAINALGETALALNPHSHGSVLNFGYTRSRSGGRHARSSSVASQHANTVTSTTATMTAIIGGSARAAGPTAA